jgi:hypothetical protein
MVVWFAFNFFYIQFFSKVRICYGMCSGLLSDFTYFPYLIPLIPSLFFYQTLFWAIIHMPYNSPFNLHNLMGFRVALPLYTLKHSHSPPTKEIQQPLTLAPVPPPCLSLQSEITTNELFFANVTNVLSPADLFGLQLLHCMTSFKGSKLSSLLY